ncbi:hypothetical protein AF40_00429 [Enterobacter roggenkampii MGH 54]|nr:hypothetical protein AF40_00429 [Enterobacter roggenkampii MGH 54]KSW31896.1 hypothetical protein APT65_20235 [Klebsiella pneumoniae]
MVILNKFYFSTYYLFENFLIKTFKEKSTCITKYFWFKNKHIWNCCINYIHCHISTLLTEYFSNDTFNTNFPVW